jgi:hypothetical protein
VVGTDEVAGGDGTTGWHGVLDLEAAPTRRAHQRVEHPLLAGGEPLGIVST